MLKVILLDAHGTITYPKKNRIEIYKNLCKKHDINKTEKEIKKYIQNMKKEHYSFLNMKMKKQGKIHWEEDRLEWFRLEALIFKKLGIKGNYYEMSWDLLTNFMNAENQELYPEVEEFLKKAIKKGYILGVVTNSDSRYRNILKHFSIDHYFKYLIISSEVQLKKPGIQIFKEAFTVFNVKPEETIYIGDTYRLDVKTAINAKVGKAFLVMRDKENKIQHPQTITLSTLLDLFSFIE